MNSDLLFSTPSQAQLQSKADSSWKISFQITDFPQNSASSSVDSLFSADKDSQESAHFDGVDSSEDYFIEQGFSRSLHLKDPISFDLTPKPQKIFESHEVKDWKEVVCVGFGKYRLKTDDEPHRYPTIQQLIAEEGSKTASIFMSESSDKKFSGILREARSSFMGIDLIVPKLQIGKISFYLPCGVISWKDGPESLHLLGP
ncbi:MAG: hypothetical protein V4507_11435 [Verrucomicrobiota bacterium]